MDYIKDVSDNIETGFANHIPLWLFGFCNYTSTTPFFMAYITSPAVFFEPDFDRMSFLRNNSISIEESN
jgi:hypothetical protein